jgi:hypothetical protein
MQEIQANYDFGRVEARMVFGQLALLLHVIHEIAATQVLDNKKQSRLGLKARMKADEKRMICCLFEHVLFRLDPVDVLVVVERRLLDHLHSIALVRFLVFDQKDFGIRTTPDDFDQVELVQADLEAARRIRLVRVDCLGLGRESRIDFDRLLLLLHLLLLLLLLLHLVLLLFGSMFVDHLLEVRHGRRLELCYEYGRCFNERMFQIIQIHDIQLLFEYVIAVLLDVLVAFLVDHYFAFETLVALSAQAPNPIVAHLAQSIACEPFHLVLVAVDEIDLAPSSSTASVNVVIFTHALGTCQLAKQNKLYIYIYIYIWSLETRNRRNWGPGGQA